jgi:hypothetical protein
MHFDPEQRQGPVGQRHVEHQQNIVRHLRSLPQEMRQPYDWIEFRGRARARINAAARRRANHRKYAAIVAAFFLMVVGLAAWMRGRETSMSYGVKPPPIVEARVDAQERWLASLPSEPIVVHVGTRAAVAGLEDRIAQLDDVLSEARVEGTQPAKLVPLEEQRARLVNSLVQVRYAETLVSASR